MKSNKLYAAAMLADEIVTISTKVKLAKKMLDNISYERVFERTLERPDPKTLEHIKNEYIEQCWKIDIVSDFIQDIYEKLHSLETLIDKYYGEDEKFIQDIALLIQEAIQNKGKVSSKKLSSVLGKGISDTE